MIAPIFFSLFQPILQQGLNQYLSLDPEIRARLKPYSGRVIRIEFTGVDVIFFLKIQGQSIAVLQSVQGPIDASLAGSPLALLQTGMASYGGKVKFSKDLQYTGDTTLIQDIYDILQKVEIDWEELLAKATGDIAAHEMGKLFRQTGTWLQQLNATVATNVSEYFQEEINILPSTMAVEDFCNDVDVIRDDVERLEQTIFLIQRYVTDSKTKPNMKKNPNKKR